MKALTLVETEAYLNSLGGFRTEIKCAFHEKMVRAHDDLTGSYLDFTAGGTKAEIDKRVAIARGAKKV